MVIAGSTCTPWSPIGLQMGLADDATEPWHVWSCEQEFLGPDIVVLENSTRAPENIWAKRICRTRSLFSIH
eukprot:10624793-Alexandrium_andersonii.AAC.1